MYAIVGCHVGSVLHKCDKCGCSCEEKEIVLDFFCCI